MGLRSWLKKDKKKQKASRAKQQAKQDVYKKTVSVNPISRNIAKKAVVVKTKGGDYPVYKKKSKTAKSFGSAFKSNCAGKGADDSFSWQGRSYSCARASDKKKAVSKPVAKKKAVIKSQKAGYDTAKKRAAGMRKRGLKTPPGL